MSLGSVALENVVYVSEQDPAKRVMCILESRCPDCAGELQLVEVSGTVEFLNDHALEDVESETWSPHNDPDDIGVYSFRCANSGTRMEAWAGAYGDWNPSGRCRFNVKREE